MKLKYLAVLAAISLLSLTTACSTPSITTSSNKVTGENRVDPCAGKKVIRATLGSPLAKKLQGKPIVIDIYASWCPACQNIAPTVAQLKEKYAGKVEFVVLDVSAQSTTKVAMDKAKELGLSEFLAENKTQTGSLTIVDPATGEILAQHRNNSDITAYTKVLDLAISK
jgi:thiol-disulfide isomerase/thioredoxin